MAHYDDGQSKIHLAVDDGALLFEERINWRHD
jgi:hypothetical protein